MAKSKKDNSPPIPAPIIVSDLSDKNLADQHQGQKIILRTPGEKDIEAEVTGAGICSIIG
ncbi:MAG TPA: hypothetical protein P5267_03295 [Patescibacteria group bacterium]|nr:hypothetical protein [Patescibacteria group bacterium]